MTNNKETTISRSQDQIIHIGASWYPEMWPEDEWARDLGRMQSLGFNVVRLFEFAWKRLEPAETHYDFGWAVRVLDLCEKFGLKVMIGTPTAAPPAWLTSKYPEVLAAKPDGTKHVHGTRKHFSHISKKYRELSAGIARRMAEVFSDHPTLLAWQIDNEMSGGDYSEEARARFHAWLQSRFNDIDSLNKAWGLQYWSQAYDRFDQIPMPTSAVGSVETPERHHPSLLLAIAEFFSAEWTAYIGNQCKAIREFSDKPITTNMCGSALGSDWFDHNKQLDRVGFSIYKDVVHYEMAIGHFDRMRGEKPGQPYWLLETAPNWSGCGKQWNIHHNAAGVQAFSWLSILLGGSMVLFWQWRSHWAGQEMLHGTCVDAAGSWRPNRGAWSALAAQFQRHGRFLLDHPPAPAQIGVVLDSRSAWTFSIDPIDDHMAYEHIWRDHYYLPLVRAGLWREVTDLTNTWERYRVLCLPHVPILDPTVRSRLEEWTKAGGRLLLGPLSGYRTEDFTAFTNSALGGLEDLIGAKIDLGFSVHWREEKVRVAFNDRTISQTRAWCDSFQPCSKNARPVAFYEGPGEYGHGRIAAVEHDLGKGKVVTLGCQVDKETYARLVKGLASESGLAPMTQNPDDVILVPRADKNGVTKAWGVINLADQPRRLMLPFSGTDRLTGKHCGSEVEIEKLGVLLIELDEPMN